MAHKCFFSVITGYSRARAGLWWPSRGWKWPNFGISARPQRGLGKNKGLISASHVWPAMHSTQQRPALASVRPGEQGMLQQDRKTPPANPASPPSLPSPRQKQRPAPRIQPSTKNPTQHQRGDKNRFFFRLKDMGNLP